MERNRPILVRAIVVIAGATLVLVGVAGLALPVLPGWALIFAGLAVLAGEFVWARRLLDSAKRRVKHATNKVRPLRADDPETGSPERSSRAS